MVLGLLTGAVTGAVKLLGGRKKKSGAKMASAIVKREPQEQQSKIKVKTKVVSVSSLMDTKSVESQDRKGIKKSSGVESIDDALDNIDNTLAGLIGTIKDRSNLQRKSIQRKNRRKAKIKKDETEEGLESKKKVPKFGMKVPRPFKSAFDTIKNFFTNIIIGSLVLWVLENVNSIMNTLKTVYEKMKEVVTKVGEFLTPVWNVFKWIVEGFSPSGLDLVNKILGNQNTKDLMDIAKINEIENQYKELESEAKGLEGVLEKFDKSGKMESAPEDSQISMNDVPPPPPAVEQQRYTISSLTPLLKSVGATDEEAVRLAAIGMHESSGNPRAHNPKYPDNSYGLFQINMLDRPGYKLGEERRNKYGITNNDLYDPQTNARVALDILRTQGWDAWSTNKSVTPAQLQRGRESLNTNNLRMGDQSKVGDNLSRQIASLMTHPSYANPRGTTIIAISDGNQSPPTQSSGDSSPMVIPLAPSRKQVMLNNYEYRVNSALWKVG